MSSVALCCSFHPLQGTHMLTCIEDSWHLINTKRCYKIRKGRYQVHERSLPGSEQELRNHCLLLHLLKASRQLCISLLSQLKLSTVLIDFRIDDRKSANPRMRGFLHAVPVIARERGIRGFFQGFVPTTARQAANSAVRFGSYTFLRQLAQSYVAPGEKLGVLSTFGIGGAAGFITVYATQPLDTIKTRMQSIEARKLYRNSFECAALIFRKEGILTFWSGALPRLVRLMLSGGIVFTMYEKSIDLMDKLDPDKRYL